MPQQRIPDPHVHDLAELMLGKEPDDAVRARRTQDLARTIQAALEDWFKQNPAPEAGTEPRR